MFSPVLWLGVLLGSVLLWASPSASKPLANATYYDTNGCLREKSQYIILVGTGGTSFDNTLSTLRQIGLGLLRMQDTEVGFCVFGSSVDCSPFEFDTLESNFLSLVSSANYAGSGNPVDAIYEAMSRFDDQPVHKRIILIQGVDYGASPAFERARDGGIEIFGIGSVNPSSVSQPISSHLIYTDANSMRERATDLLRLIRKQKGDTCFAWGFGQTHILTFDGLMYDFSGVGDYHLFQSNSFGEDNFQVQIRQLTRPANSDLREGVTQIRAVSVDAGNTNYIVKYDPDEKLLRFVINSNTYLVSDLDIVDDSQYLGFDYRLYETSTSEMSVRTFEPFGAYVIVIKTYTTGSSVTISFSDHGSSIFVRPAGTDFGASNGLCGFYDGCPNNDLKKRDNTILDSSSDRKIVKSSSEFIEDWRIQNIFESSFDLEGFEEYSPSDGWKAFASNKGHKNADQACSDLPELIQEACLFDVGARSHVYASFPSKFLIGSICAAYCLNKDLLFHDIFDVENTCKLTCLSYEALMVGVDLHEKYNTTYNPPEFLLRGGEGAAIFKPVVNVGGSYVFQLKTNDRCLALERNITFRITCDEPPIVKANSFFNLTEDETENRIEAKASDTGLPFINLFGSITGGSKGNTNYRASWKVVNASLPYGETEDSFPLDMRLDVSQSSFYGFAGLHAIWKPKWIGQYEIELAVNDGCQVVRSVVFIDVTCSKCNPLVRIAPFNKNLWNKINNNFGYWQISELYLSFGAIAPVNLLTHRWSVISKDGASIEKVGDYNYEVYKPISPRTSLKTTTETEVSTSSPSDTQTDNGFPFTQSVIPYRVNELRVVDTTITWTQTTTTITEEVFIPEKRENICNIYHSNLQSNYLELEFDEYDLNDNLAKCTGYYTIQSVTDDSCDPLGSRAVTDTAILHLDCGLPPRVFLTCNTHSEYQYNGAYFDQVYLDGSATYDPRPSADSNGYQLIYSWDLVSVPPGSSYSTGDLGENDRDYYFIPDIKGTYVLRLTASNQCNKESALITVEATCVAPPVILGTQVENAKLIFDGSDGSPAFVFNVTATHEFQNNLDYTWSVVSSPQIPSEFSDLVSEPDFYGSFEDPTLSVYYGGNYVVKVAVSDGCQLPVNQTVNIEYVCPGSLNIVIAPIPATIEYDYDVNSFPQVVLNASQSTALDGGAGYTPSTFFAWYVIAAPIEGLPTTPIGSGDTESFNLPFVGKYSFRLVFSDYCLYSFSELSFTLVCPHNPVPVPVLFEPTPSEIFVGNTTFFGDNSQDDKIDNIEWELVVSPQNVDLGTTYGGKNVTYVPSLPGVYIFQATGEDGCKTASANITFTVKCIPVDYSPSAALGTPTSTYSKGKFSRVEMYDLGTGLGSTDPDSLEYRWIVTSAPLGSIYYPRNELNITEETTSYNYTNDDVDNSTFTIVTERVVFYRREIRYVEIRNADYPTRTFASCFYPDLPGTYRVKLTISKSDIDNICDSRNSTELSIQAVCNNAPTINVNDQTVTLTPNKYTRVNLDASATIDADGDALTYSWTVDPLQGDNKHLEQLTTYSSPIASFIVYAQGTYSIQLTVSDGCQNVTRVVTINANCPLDDDVVEDKKKKKEDLDTFAFTFDRKDIAFTEFEFINKTATDLCTGEYSWELIDYKIVGSGVFKIEPFSTFALVILFALVQLFN